jgi:hypothetical protein
MIDSMPDDRPERLINAVPVCWPNGFELSASSLYRKLTEQGEISPAHRA